mgnify:CR=1 FL=1
MNSILQKHIAQKFVDTFNKKPLLVFSPGRINLIGEHTDYNNGFVFPAAIDKGIYCAIEKSAKNYSTIIALDVKDEFTIDLNSVSKYSFGSWKNYVLGIINEIQNKGKSISNFNLVFSGDIPSGAGLSSSAALENSVVFGLNELFQLQLSKKEMINISQKAEHNFVGVNCGIMDQFASMFGEENSALLLDCKRLSYDKVELNLKGIEILLINTNVKHSLAESAYNDRRKTCERVASLLQKKALREVDYKSLQTIKEKISEEDFQKALFVIEENQRVLNAKNAIDKNDITTLGSLLFESHKGLSHQYNVSCDELDYLVKLAKESSSVFGARMMGGGFGGCTINLVKLSEKEAFITTIKQQYFQQFNTNCSVYEVKLSNGTQILL